MKGIPTLTFVIQCYSVLKIDTTQDIALSIFIFIYIHSLKDFSSFFSWCQSKSPSSDNILPGGTSSPGGQTGGGRWLGSRSMSFWSKEVTQKSEMIGAPKWDPNMKKNVSLSQVIYFCGLCCILFLSIHELFALLNCPYPYSQKTFKYLIKMCHLKSVKNHLFLLKNSLFRPWWWISGTMSLDMLPPSTMAGDQGLVRSARAQVLFLTPGWICQAPLIRLVGWSRWRGGVPF